MKGISIAHIGALAALSFFAGPELFSRPVQAEVVDPCEGLQEWTLVANGEPADELVERLRGNEQFFIANASPEGLGIDLDIDDLRELLREIDRDPTRVLDTDVPDAMRGIGGFSTTLFLKKLILGVHQTVYGKIRDYIFVDRTKSGHLSVDMCIDRSEFYHWDIEIANGGFGVHLRKGDPDDPNDPYYPDNPFPNVDLDLPEGATDPDEPTSIWVRGLDHKLHARGKSIEVRHIYHRSLSDPDLTRLDDNHHLYMSTEASCVDLFTQGRPPATFGELTDSDYCLGRCEHPAIVNTGG